MTTYNTIKDQVPTSECQREIQHNKANYFLLPPTKTKVVDLGSLNPVSDQTELVPDQCAGSSAIEHWWSRVGCRLWDTAIYLWYKTAYQLKSRHETRKRSDKKIFSQHYLNIATCCKTDTIAATHSSSLWFEKRGMSELLISPMPNFRKQKITLPLWYAAEISLCDEGSI